MRGQPKNRTRHDWTDADDAALLAAVEGCLPLREMFTARLGWWGCVLGRSGLDVTPDAARSRWERLEARRRDTETAARLALEHVAEQQGVTPGTVESGWDRVARQIEEYEATVGEATLETATEVLAVLGQVQRATTRTERMLTALCRDLGIALPQDGEP